MANVNAAFGFVPVRHMSSSPIRTNKYTITSGLAENIFTGDLVIITADGVTQSIGQQVQQQQILLLMCMTILT